MYSLQLPRKFVDSFVHAVQDFIYFPKLHIDPVKQQLFKDILWWPPPSITPPSVPQNRNPIQPIQYNQHRSGIANDRAWIIAPPSLAIVVFVAGLVDSPQRDLSKLGQCYLHVSLAMMIELCWGLFRFEWKLKKGKNANNSIPLKRVQWIYITLLPLLLLPRLYRPASSSRGMDYQQYYYYYSLVIQSTLPSPLLLLRMIPSHSRISFHFE